MGVRSCGGSCLFAPLEDGYLVHAPLLRGNLLLEFPYADIARRSVLIYTRFKHMDSAGVLGDAEGLLGNRQIDSSISSRNSTFVMDGCRRGLRKSQLRLLGGLQRPDLLSCVFQR